MTQVRFVSRPGFGEVRRLTFEQGFRSLSTQAVHGFGWGERGASESELEAFRGYVRGAGQLRSGQTWSHGIAGFAIGFVLAVGLPFAFGIARFA